MTRMSYFYAALALTVYAGYPAVALAEEGMEGLDITMIVLDDPASLEGELAEMRGPNDRDVDREDWEDDGQGEDESESEPFENNEASGRLDEYDDDFERDSVREEEELAHEDDFEEGEDVDLDEYDFDDDDDTDSDDDDDDDDDMS